MNRINRQMIAAATLLVAAVVSTPTMATAQRSNQRLSMFVAVSFRSPGEPKLGIEVADQVRQRMAKLFSQTPQALTRPGALRVITREQINQQLTAAAYPADSVITSTDLRDLGKNIGADETMEGTAQRTAKGIEVHARFYSLNHIEAPEVLPTVVGKDEGDVGREVAELYAKARRELPDYERCRSALISNQPDQAIISARAALQQNDKGVLPRACLLTAFVKQYQAKKVPADSVIKVANEILQTDPNYEIAIGSLADVYLLQGDTTHAVEMNLRLYKLNPTNVGQAQSIVQMLAGMGSPEKAVPIAKELLGTNPGDPQLLDTYWKLLMATKAWKEAIAAGEEMVKFDSSKADTIYFSRQISNAVNDSNPALTLQFLAKATQKFPRNTRFWLGYSQELRKQGQLQQALDAAKKALDVNPKVDNGMATVLSLYVQLGQTDSAIAFGKRAIAAGADKQAVGPALLTLLTPAYNKTKDPNATPADWENLYRMAATVDTIAPQPGTKFFMSFGAFTLGVQALAPVADLAKAHKTAEACAAVKTAADYFLVVDLNMMAGGAFSKEAAGQILNQLNTYKPYIDQYKKGIPCK
ncbi:MAG TPA: hypothetical protein VIV65_05290 [Gemmatimonadaceae bacterium]